MVIIFFLISIFIFFYYKFQQQKMANFVQIALIASCLIALASAGCGPAPRISNGQFYNVEYSEVNAMTQIQCDPGFEPYSPTGRFYARCDGYSWIHDVTCNRVTQAPTTTRRPATQASIQSSASALNFNLLNILSVAGIITLIAF